MIELQELKVVNLMKHLSDDMIRKLIPITKLKEFKAGEYIFKAGDAAGYLYSVKEGLVHLEVDVGSQNPIYLRKIETNSTFGTSSLVDIEERNYLISAKAIQESKIYQWETSQLIELFESDYEMGYRFMTRIAKVIQSRFTAKDKLVREFYNYLKFGRTT